MGGTFLMVLVDHGGVPGAEDCFWCQYSKVRGTVVASGNTDEGEELILAFLSQCTGALAQPSRAVARTVGSIPSDVGNLELPVHFTV
jgi:hypothetical protein